MNDDEMTLTIMMIDNEDEGIGMTLFLLEIYVSLLFLTVKASRVGER